MTPAGYRLEGLIGQGGTGTVHRARRLRPPHSVVAVKRVRVAGAPDVVARLRTEAEVLASLDHPHVVRVLDVVPDGAGVAVVMQYASGGSVAGLLALRGRLSPEEAVGVAVPVAEALASAHRRGVLHCDVKPANILLTADGEPLLSDFGLSRWVGRPSAAAGHMAGTAGYVDPEVVGGARPDESSDLYGLGAVCHEMLTGRRPGPGRAPLLEAAPGTPPELAAVVERALAPRRQDRHRHASAMAAALRASVAGAVVPTPASPGVQPPAAGPRPVSTCSFGPRPPAAPGRAPGPGPVRPSVRLALAAALLVTLVGTVVLLRPERPGVAEAAPERLGCPDARSPLRGDVDGDGCAEEASWSGDVLEVAGRRYRLGVPGDELVLGDWDCDGRDTPALYRPGSGEVFVFDGWAESTASLGAAVVQRRAAHGSVGVEMGGRGCDRVVVR